MKRILFVCTGNICRSPTAEAIFRTLVKEKKLEGAFHIDSAGLLDYHEGDGPDPRTLEAALKRGYDLSQIRSRPIVRDDFHGFDFLMAMDRTHLKAMTELCPDHLRDQKIIRLIMDYSRQWTGHDVPDPYFGGDAGFELVLDMLEEACGELLNQLQKE